MKRFCTEYDGPDGRYGGHVDALDWEHARRLAAERDPPHTVIGVLYAVVVPGDETEFDPDQFLRDLADSPGMEEPPDASEFGEL